ncbi:MAG: hypothetical protein Q6373_015665 [Candidatus Sigynarchaeota archaeon]
MSDWDEPSSDAGVARKRRRPFLEPPPDDTDHQESYFGAAHRAPEPRPAPELVEGEESGGRGTRHRMVFEQHGHPGGLVADVATSTLYVPSLNCSQQFNCSQTGVLGMGLRLITP